MPRPDVDQLDSQIERLRGGGTLTENEVKVLCDKVSFFHWHLCVCVWVGKVDHRLLVGLAAHSFPNNFATFLNG
jgi:hypothetical protein